MAAPIDFYFDFSSPYGYLASHKIDGLAAKYGRDVAWRPYLLGVALKVTVDGKDAEALGVMSQGELHSLALSLFLPRATLPDSPFRFICVDDPVQSMDPARVEGLARVLPYLIGRRKGRQGADTRAVRMFPRDASA